LNIRDRLKKRGFAFFAEPPLDDFFLLAGVFFFGFGDLLALPVLARLLCGFLVVGFLVADFLVVAFLTVDFLAVGFLIVDLLEPFFFVTALFLGLSGDDIFITR